MDAEGCFLIRRKEFFLKKKIYFSVSLSFKIKLHKDDAEVLYIIKNKLGVGNIRFHGNEVIFAIEKFHDIWTICNNCVVVYGKNYKHPRSSIVSSFLKLLLL